MADEEQQNDELMTAPRERLASILADMREARRAYQANEFSAGDYLDKIRDLDQQVIFRLSNRFNRFSGVTLTLSQDQISEEFRSRLSEPLRRRLPSVNTEQTFIERLEARSNAPPGFFDEGNEETSGKIIFEHIIEGHPQLSTLTYEDAVAIYQDTMPEDEYKTRFGSVDTAIIAAAVVATFEVNEDKLKEEHPDIAEDLNDETNSLSSQVAEYFATSVEPDEEYTAWEGQKRAQLLTAIQADRGLMENIQKLKPLLDSESERDFMRQVRLRQDIVDDMRQIYARVYGVEIPRSNVLSNFTSVETFNDDSTLGYAFGIPVISGEQRTIIRTSLAEELVATPTRITDYDVTNAFFNTVCEELKHTTDLALVQQMVDDKLPLDHPTFRHANLLIFNHAYYNNNEDGMANYESQYLERTAKDNAEAVTQGVMSVLPPQPGAPEPASVTPGPAAQISTPGQRQ